MDILVRRTTRRRSQRDVFWRGLGHECPSYSNRSVDDSDSWTDFDERIVDFRSAQKNIQRADSFRSTGATTFTPAQNAATVNREDAARRSRRARARAVPEPVKL